MELRASHYLQVHLLTHAFRSVNQIIPPPLFETHCKITKLNYKTTTIVIPSSFSNSWSKKLFKPKLRRSCRNLHWFDLALNELSVFVRLLTLGSCHCMTSQIHTQFWQSCSFFLVASDLVSVSAGQKKHYASALCLLISFFGCMSLTNSLLHGFCIKQMLTQSQSLTLWPARTQQGVSPRQQGFVRLRHWGRRKPKSKAVVWDLLRWAECRLQIILFRRGGGGGRKKKS